MTRRLLIVASLISVVSFPLFASETSRPEETDTDQPSPAVDSEASGIIPDGGITVSTQPITPIEPLAMQDPYAQALKALDIAQDLLQKGHMEACSDVALQAYDDLMSVHFSRRSKDKRKKLRADRHQAAIVYVTASLAYIDEFVKRGGGGTHITEEGRSRVTDLRDVSTNYPELNKKVSEALYRYTVETSTIEAH
jgi:hypothetical protein